MADTGWVVSPFAGERDDKVAAAVVASFRGVYQRHFSEEWLVNHDLPVEVRALRQSDGWQVMLLLTPWMLARVFLPARLPGIAIPGWRAAERASAPYTVIGPPVTFSLLGAEHKAHLNYHPDLGHFLIQPLVQSMDNYASADEVFAAWDEVIRTRDRVMEEQKRECGWQKEVSRREFLGRLAGR
jgi:hypothetical protein